MLKKSQHNYLFYLHTRNRIWFQEGCSPLHVAARKGIIDSVVALLCTNSVVMGGSISSPLDVNVTDEVSAIDGYNDFLACPLTGCPVQQRKCTALMYAAQCGHAEIVRTLLRWEAEAHCVDNVSCCEVVGTIAF